MDSTVPEDSTDEEGTNLQVRTVKKFHANRFLGLGVRKDRANNTSKVLNLFVHKGCTIQQIAYKLKLTERSVSRILSNDVVRSELENCRERLKGEAVNRVRQALKSKDDKTGVYAAKVLNEVLESGRHKDNNGTAPVIDMTALVSSVASNLLAGAMLGIRSTLQDNSRSPAIGTDEVQVLSTSMGSTSTVQSSTVPEDQYVDPEQLNVPDDDVPI